MERSLNFTSSILWEWERHRERKRQGQRQKERRKKLRKKVWILKRDAVSTGIHSLQINALIFQMLTGRLSRVWGSILEKGDVAPEERLFVCLLKAYKHANRTGLPQGFHKFKSYTIKKHWTFNYIIHTNKHTQKNPHLYKSKHSTLSIALEYNSK